MAVRPILQGEVRVLHQPARTVTSIQAPEVLQLITDLTDTMRANDLVGLAAPQIGSGLQIFVTEVRTTKARAQRQTDALRVFINPELNTLAQDQVEIYEGCGSCSGTDQFGPVTRPKEVTVTALNARGKKFRLQCNGLLGRVVQHELDHLAGTLFTEYIGDPDRLISKQTYIDKIRNSPDQINIQKVTVKKTTYLDP